MQWRSDFNKRSKTQEDQDRLDFLDVVMPLAHKYGGTIEPDWETNELNFLIPKENMLAFFIELEEAAMNFYGVRRTPDGQNSLFYQ